MTFHKKSFVTAFTLATVLVVGQAGWSSDASADTPSQQMNQGTMQEMMTSMENRVQQCQEMMNNE